MRCARPRWSAGRCARPAPRRSGRDRSTRAATCTESSSELLQHPHVVLEELAQVGHAVPQHRDPLDPHAEGEALDPLRVVAALPHEAEHVRIDHPGAEDLDPARALAQRVAAPVVQMARATAAEAGDIYLHAWLREGEEPRPEPGLALRA